LQAAGAENTSRELLEPLRDSLRLFGFHGYALDVREDSDRHTKALDEITGLLCIILRVIAGNAP